MSAAFFLFTEKTSNDGLRVGRAHKPLLVRTVARVADFDGKPSHHNDKASNPDLCERLHSVPLFRVVAEQPIESFEDRFTDVGKEVAHLCLRFLALGRLGTLTQPVQSGLNSVDLILRQHLRPLRNGGRADLARIGGGCDGSAEQLEGFLFQHAPMLAR